MVQLGNLQVEIGADTSGLKKAEQEVKKTGKTLETSFNKVGAAIAAAITTESARRVLIIADNMVRLEGTIKRLTRTTGDFNKVWSQLSKVSNENGVAISDSVALFQRFQSSLEGITDSNQDVISFIDNLQKLGRIGGSSAEELSNALIQLSQGLSGGIIRAEEWNSVMEQAPEILKSAANNIEGINGDMGKLRQVMLDGELTADKMFAALQKGAEDTNKEFEELPRTIDMASNSLKNNFAAAISAVDKEIGGSENIAKFIDFIAEGMGAIGNVESAKNIEKQIIGVEARLKSLNMTLAESKKHQSGGLLTDAFEFITGEDMATGTDEVLAKIKEEEKLLSELKKKRDGFKEEESKGSTINTKKKFLFQQEGFGETSEQDAKALQAFSEAQKEKEKASQASLDAIFMMNKTEKQKLAMLETEALSAIDDLYLEDQINFEQSEAAKIEIGKNFAKQRAELEQETVSEVARAYDQLSKTIGDSLGAALAGTQSWADAMKTIIADLASQLIQAGIVSAFGGSVSGGNVFADLFSGAATGGGRAMGGTTSGSLMHPINERGTPEILKQAGKQYLLPTGQNGKITPLGQNQGGGSPNISMINMGTPQEVQGVSITKDGVEIMIADSLKKYDQGLTAELGKPGTKKGKSIQSAFKIPVNVGRS